MSAVDDTNPALPIIEECTIMFRGLGLGFRAQSLGSLRLMQTLHHQQ